MLTRLRRTVSLARQSLNPAVQWWLPDQSNEHLEAIRVAELKLVNGLLPAKSRILEIGAGTGWQSRELSRWGHSVSAIEVGNSHQIGGGSQTYRQHRVWPIIDYDGHQIPFGDASFDVVYSSNVLEHVAHLNDFEEEIHRVLTTNGVAVHVLPSGSWRFWTNATFFLRHFHRVKLTRPRTWIPHRHGERGNGITEIVEFSRRTWHKHFIDAGWWIDRYCTNRLLYTGYSVFDSRLGLRPRQALSSVFGSSCHVFVLKHG